MQLMRQLPNPILDPFRIKLIPASDPLARNAFQVRQRYPGTLPIRYDGLFLGGQTIDGANVYPTPMGVPNA